jgi:hypothetical protein
VDADIDLPKPCGSCQIAEFRCAKCGLNRHRTIVQRDGIPAEEPASGRKEMLSEKVPLQVACDNVEARDAAERPEQLDDRGVFEMMEE